MSGASIGCHPRIDVESANRAARVIERGTAAHEVVAGLKTIPELFATSTENLFPRASLASRTGVPKHFTACEQLSQS
jgi:hypothetical protein